MLPANILYRPKQGFVVPLAAGFAGRCAQRVRSDLSGPVLRQSGLFDMATIASLLDQHQSGRRDHSPALWSLSMFEGFLRQVHPHPQRPKSNAPRRWASVP